MLKFQSRSLSTPDCSSLHSRDQPQKAVILKDSKATLQFLISNTPDQPNQCRKACSFSHKNAPWSYSGSLPTVIPRNERAYRLAKSGANNCNPCPLPLTRKPKPCSETVKASNGEGPLETTTPLQTQSTIWQDMSRLLYSGCEQDTAACERIMDSALCNWTEAQQTVHHMLQFGLSRLAPTETQVMAARWVNHQRAVGNAEDLRCNIQFLATYGLRVKVRLIDRRRRMSMGIMWSTVQPWKGSSATDFDRLKITFIYFITETINQWNKRENRRTSRKPPTS